MIILSFLLINFVYIFVRKAIDTIIKFKLENKGRDRGNLSNLDRVNFKVASKIFLKCLLTCTN